MIKKEKILILIKLIILSLIVGVMCGLVGSLFHYTLHFAAETFSGFPWLIWFLVPAGLLVVLLYNILKVGNSYSTVSVIKSIREEKNLPNGLSAAIFASTFLTHLFGGSSGREGAALQLGGSIGDIISEIKCFNVNEKYKRTITMCGMSGLFAALFGTPLAAAVFVLTIIHLRSQYKKAIIPCILSSYSAYFVAKLLGNSGVRYFVELPKFNFDILWKLAVVIVAGALISIIFCLSIEYSKKISNLIKNEYLRIVVGGAIVLALTIILKTNDYNGAGSSVIERAINGEAKPEAFLLKILFTSVTLSFGYKGGEIVPSFFVGSTLGCFLGGLLGLDPGFAAAVGMMAVFCGVTNCPIATIIMSAEVFGLEKMPIFIPVCILSFAFSGRHSLYGKRDLILKKLIYKLKFSK